MTGILRRLFSSEQAVDLKRLVDQGALIVDVRTAEEYQTGHIKNSINIPLADINRKIPELKRQNKVIITCCRSGTRSGMAKNLLGAQSIECYNGGPWNTLNAKIS